MSRAPTLFLTCSQGGRKGLNAQTITIDSAKRYHSADAKLSQMHHRLSPYLFMDEKARCSAGACARALEDATAQISLVSSSWARSSCRNRCSNGSDSTTSSASRYSRHVSRRPGSASPTTLYAGMY